jgi:hypothetical protein
MENNTAIYVDFDECLIHGFNENDGRNPTHEEVKQDFEVTSIPDEGKQYIIVLRPGVREFLAALKKITPNVMILTAGKKDFQTKAAQAAGLLELVSGLYGRDSEDVPQFPISVLIDDLWIQCQNTFRKSQQMGIIDKETVRRTQYGPWSSDDTDNVVAKIDKHYIQIKHFDATNKNDNGFNEILPKIEPKLQAQRKEIAEVIQEKIISYFKEDKVLTP